MQMKRVVVIIVVLLISSALYAQRSFTFGPKVGFTNSKLTTNQNEIEEAFKANFQFGAFMRFGKRVYVQPELSFVTKGGLFTTDQVLGLKEIDLKTMEGSLIIGSKLFDLGTFSLAFLAGPSVSTVFDKSFRIRDELSPVSPDELKKKLDDAMWGIQAGVGLDALMFTLHVKYEWGLNDIYNHQGVEMKNTLVNVSLGWKLL